MNARSEDQIAFDALAFAFSGNRAMPAQQHRKVRAAIRQSRIENFETRGKKRSRLWGYGPVWGRYA